jgi:hypothetical protein
MSHRLGGLADFKFAAQINSTFTALVAGQDRDDLCLRESGFLHESKVRCFSYFRVHRLRGSLQTQNQQIAAHGCVKVHFEAFKGCVFCPDSTNAKRPEPPRNGDYGAFESVALPGFEPGTS